MVPASNPILEREIVFLSIFRGLDKLFPISYIQVLLFVSTKPNSCMTEIAEGLGLSQAAVSKCIATLGLERWNGEAGFNLVTSQNDPSHRSYKRVSLTRKGEEFVGKLEEVLVENEQPIEGPQKQKH